MAIQLSTIVRGKLSNIVMYKLGDIPIARMKPAKVRKTANMKICSTNFGIAAKAGKILRQALDLSLDKSIAQGMPSLFSGAINKWLGTTPLKKQLPDMAIAGLYNFSFNKKTSFYERFKKTIDWQLNAGGNISLQLHSFVATQNIAAPAHTKKVELQISLAACQLSSMNTVGDSFYKKSFDYDEQLHAAETINFNINLPAKTLLVIVASLHYYFADGRVEKRPAFVPVSVIAAAYK